MMVPIHALQWYRFADTVTKDAKFRDKAKKLTINDETVYISNQFNPGRIKEFIQKVNAQDWGINIEKIEE